MKQLFVFLLLLTTMGNSLMAQVIKETADANHIGGLCMEGDSTYHIRHNIDLNGKHVLLEEGATISGQRHQNCGRQHEATVWQRLTTAWQLECLCSSRMVWRTWRRHSLLGISSALLCQLYWKCSGIKFDLPCHRQLSLFTHHQQTDLETFIPIYYRSGVSRHHQPSFFATQ